MRILLKHKEGLDCRGRLRSLARTSRNLNSLPKIQVKIFIKFQDTFLGLQDNIG